MGSEMCIRDRAETQDQYTPVVTMAEETVVPVPVPTPMVAGTDLPVPSTDSGATVIVQPQTRAEPQEEGAPEELVVVEGISDEIAAQVTTVVVGSSETEVSEYAVGIEAPTALDTQENQPNVVQNASPDDKSISVSLVDTPAE